MKKEKQILKVLVGVNAAPPLGVEKVKEYRPLAETIVAEIAEPFLRLCDLVELFHETGESSLPPIAHLSGRVAVVPLEDEEKARIDDLLPWPHELDLYGSLFDRLDPTSEKAQRNAAFHLLWFARELDLGREPITTDKL